LSASEHRERRLLASLGKTVRRLREAQGLDVSELAEASGTRPERIQALEAGQFDPTYDLLVALAAALGVQPSALIIRAEELGASESS
jgi:XRE family transcriptional regulator, regulator of sulfur utilization